MVKEAKNPQSETAKRLTKKQKEKAYQKSIDDGLDMLAKAQEKERKAILENPDVFVNLAVMPLDSGKIVVENKSADSGYPCLQSAFIGFVVGIAVASFVLYVRFFL